MPKELSEYGNFGLPVDASLMAHHTKFEKYATSNEIYNQDPNLSMTLYNLITKWKHNSSNRW